MADARKKRTPSSPASDASGVTKRVKESGCDSEDSYQAAISQIQTAGVWKSGVDYETESNEPLYIMEKASGEGTLGIDNIGQAIQQMWPYFRKARNAALQLKAELSNKQVKGEVNGLSANIIRNLQMVTPYLKTIELFAENKNLRRERDSRDGSTQVTPGKSTSGTRVNRIENPPSTTYASVSAAASKN